MLQTPGGGLGGDEYLCSAAADTAVGADVGSHNQRQSVFFMEVQVEAQNPMPCYEVIGLSDALKPVPRWHLDSPSHGMPYERRGHDGVRLRGWVLTDGARRVGVAVRAGGVTRAYPLNQWRGDVLRKVLDLVPEEHPDLVCGFDLVLPEVAEFDFGLDLDGVLVWLKRIRWCGGSVPVGGQG